MANPTLAQIRQGLANRAATISGLRTNAYQTDKPEPPYAAVLPVSATFDDTFSGGATYQLDLWLYINSADLVSAQMALDEYMMPSGAKSLHAAVDGDRTLGGVVDGCRIVGWVEYARQVDLSGVKALGAALRVEVQC